MAETPIITRVLDSIGELDASLWNALLATQPVPTPFMRHEYLLALEQSGSAVADTGWLGRIISLWRGSELLAACPVYIKGHSYGEYVFDWAWARAYAEHGLHYYPKAVLAVPFTPVPGTRLLARAPQWRQALVVAVRRWAVQQRLSSLHLLFSEEADQQACEADGWMARSTVQFHWSNHTAQLAGPESAAATVLQSQPLGRPFRDFDDFLASLTQEKRKKIRQERRKVAEAGVQFQVLRGCEISPQDWDFFYRCYERTYLEHGNAPYLSRAFFTAMQTELPDAWVMFIAERGGQRIASSLIAVSADVAPNYYGISSDFGMDQAQAAIPTIAGSDLPRGTAYGRYWGALERVDCLHFEACYYQPLQWCIEHGVASFEGGAQGAHKMARALLPVVTPSAHWIAHEGFAEAIARFLDREGEGMQAYYEELHQHSPLKPLPSPT